MCQFVLSQVSFDFLPPEYAAKLQSAALDSGSFISMEIEKDEKAVDAMLREGQESAIDALESKENEKSEKLALEKSKNVGTKRMPLSTDELIDQLTSVSAVSARFVLMASAGLGKTVFLKKLCISVNQRAVDAKSTCAPIAIFVRAGADIDFYYDYY